MTVKVHFAFVFFFFFPDGVTDCSDSDCCSQPVCSDQPHIMCLASNDPVEVLLRKQPPSVTASFYQRVKFLVEENSVQSYAHMDEYSERWEIVYFTCMNPVLCRKVFFPWLAFGVPGGAFRNPFVLCTYTIKGVQIKTSLGLPRWKIRGWSLINEWVYLFRVSVSWLGWYDSLNIESQGIWKKIL